MKRVWLVLVLALLMGDFTATSASDFTIATSAEQDTVLQALTDSANVARAIENARIAEETARLAALRPPPPPPRVPLPVLALDALRGGQGVRVDPGARWDCLVVNRP